MALTPYLQQEFAQRCPPGWRCQREARVLSPDLENLLGYAPRADVVLEREDGSRRLWIEFEVSRADPAANHVKFATAHLFRPLPDSHAFVAMVSPHVTRGRRNLAANTLALLRHVGLNAFQTVLFPHASPAEIRRLNHLDSAALSRAGLDVAAEMERVFAVATLVLSLAERRIHLAGDLLTVMLNLKQWNDELATDEGRSRWGRRTVTYFVHDPRSKLFAPSKFCAYEPVVVAPPAVGSLPSRSSTAIMTVDLYVTLDGTDARFDGHRARTHLTSGLGMVARTGDELPEMRDLFERWLDRHRQSVTVHPLGPVFLLASEWF